MTSAPTYTYGIDYNPVMGVVTRVRGRKKGVQGFLSVDPLTGKYPELSPYQFASNTPIEAVDIDGLEGGHPSVVQSLEQGGTVIQAVDNAHIVKLIIVYESSPFPTPRQEFIGPAYDRLQPERPSLFDASPLFSEHFSQIGSKISSVKTEVKTFKLALQTTATIAKGTGTSINNNLVNAGYRYMSAIGSDIQMNTSTDLGLRLRQLSTSPRGGTSLFRYGAGLGKLAKKVGYIGLSIDTYDNYQGNITGARLGYNAGSLVAGLAIGARYGGPYGLAASVVLTGGQTLYDMHQEAKLAPQPEPDFRTFDEKVNDGFEQLEDVGKDPNSSNAPF